MEFPDPLSLEQVRVARAHFRYGEIALTGGVEHRGYSHRQPLKYSDTVFRPDSERDAIVATFAERVLGEGDLFLTGIHPRDDDIMHTFLEGNLTREESGLGMKAWFTIDTRRSGLYTVRVSLTCDEDTVRYDTDPDERPTDAGKTQAAIIAMEAELRERKWIFASDESYDDGDD